ncbi:MAG TPA: metalloregulator ArsR/SmtB family transcription factor [Parafilimonas sp.]|nr:metalloregulator ArsR/SmtB family transcription factor [Parafilimonas sp.]
MNSTQSSTLHNPDINEDVQIDFVHLKKAAMILRALNHKLRQQLLHLLDEHKKVTVTEIYVKLRLEQSVVSQHLAIMRRAGVVTTKREGKFIYYSVNYNRIKEISAFVEQLCG